MMEHMASPDLEDFCFHINAKISDIKKFLLLRDIGKEQCRKSMLHKIGTEVILVHDLLNKMEAEVKQQEKLKDLLKEIQKAAERDQNEAQHLLEHVPPYLPKPTQRHITVPAVKHEEQTKVVEPKRATKPAKQTKLIKEAALITTEEFESVPAYMKGRLTYDQINAVVQEINKAVVSKYKILHQPLKSMSVPVRNLYHRFMEDETKGTEDLMGVKGMVGCMALMYAGLCRFCKELIPEREFFIVEADMKEFTQMKMDKRFHSILNILRHCQRVREVRGSGLVRYIIC